MKTNIEIKQRDTYAIIEITRPDGKVTRIAVGDRDDDISITTTDGAMIVYPKTTNQILIRTADQ